MSKFKVLLKRILPQNILQGLRNAKSRVDGYRLFLYDKKRFEKSYFRKYRKANADQLKAKLTFHAHALEKGFSHDDLRLGFGKRALQELATSLKAYDRNGFDKSDLEYINALSALKEYITIHNKAGYNIDYINKMFGPLVNEAVNCKSDIAGAKLIYKEDKAGNSDKNFEELFKGRYSVREYSDEPVDDNLITESIEIAMKAPSVCNRQASRVHILSDKEKIKKALNIQGGMTGYATPPRLLIITTDSSNFLAITERNQVYIDGGLFAMSLLLALEYKALAACPLNAMFSIKKDKSLRQLIDLKPSENIIVLISVGNFKTRNNVPKSFRLSGQDISSFVERG